MADVIIKGGKELHDFLQTLPVKIEKNIMRSALSAGAKVIANEAKKNVSVKHGKLRASIRVSSRVKGRQISASAKAGNEDAWYWRFVEFGTAAHLISVQDSERGINASRSRYLGREVKISMTTINRNVLKIGNHFIGPTVSHPGARARPFMRPALDAKAIEAITAVGKKIGERLTKHGINNAPAFELGGAE